MTVLLWFLAQVSQLTHCQEWNLVCSCMFSPRHMFLARARDKIVMKNDIWSDPETHKLHFILKYSGQGAHDTGKTAQFLFSLAAILFSSDFERTRLVTWQHSPSNLGPFFISLAWCVYLESTVIQKLYSSFSHIRSTSVQTSDHKKINKIQRAIKLISFFPEAKISFIAGLLGGRYNM